MKIAVVGATGRVGRHVVDVLEGRGHDVVAVSRGHGVDVITGTGLDAALAGVDCVVDVATGPSADRDEATRFFTTAAANLQRASTQAGVAIRNLDPGHRNRATNCRSARESLAAADPAAAANRLRRVVRGAC